MQNVSRAFFKTKNMNNYVLLKDLPDVNAGAVAEWIEDANAFKMEKSAWVSPHRYCWMSAGTVTQSPEWFMQQFKKPPLGLTPIYIHKEFRRDDIFSAIKRLHTEGRAVPGEWLNELIEIEQWLNDN